jgi:hypothetical protein
LLVHHELLFGFCFAFSFFLCNLLCIQLSEENLKKSRWNTEKRQLKSFLRDYAVKYSFFRIAEEKKFQKFFGKEKSGAERKVKEKLKKNQSQFN